MLRMPVARPLEVWSATGAPTAKGHANTLLGPVNDAGSVLACLTTTLGRPYNVRCYSSQTTLFGELMRYHDTGSQDPAHALATWMANVVTPGLAELRIQSGYFTRRALGAVRDALGAAASEDRITRVLV